MFKYSIISILLLVLNCRSGYSQSRAEKQCDKIKENYQSAVGNYISSGREASLGELPYMVALAHGKKKYNIYYCGASLVSETCIVTAAHCVNTTDPIIVRIGTTDVSDIKWNPKTDHQIARKIIHPQYKSPAFHNDLAVLKLDSPVALSSNVYPICLATNKADPKGELVVSGWGLTRPDGMRQTHLHLTKVEAISNEDCKRTYRGKTEKIPFGITPEFLCANGKARANTCQGDSGGPMVLPGKNGASTLEGVTSFGVDCATPYPVVYTRISSYADWIAETCDFPE